MQGLVGMKESLLYHVSRIFSIVNQTQDRMEQTILMAQYQLAKGECIALPAFSDQTVIVCTHVALLNNGRDAARNGSRSEAFLSTHDIACATVNRQAESQAIA